MVALVTLSYVKSALRIDSDDDDVLLAAYIAAASAAVVRYLGARAEFVLDLDSGGDLPSGSEVPDDVQLAVVLLTGHFYREPDADTDKAFEQGYLPKPVTALLYPLRDPALA